MSPLPWVVVCLDLYFSFQRYGLLLFARVIVLPSALTFCPMVFIGQDGSKLAPSNLYYLERVAKHWLKPGMTDSDFSTDSDSYKFTDIDKNQ